MFICGNKKMFAQKVKATVEKERENEKLRERGHRKRKALIK